MALYLFSCYWAQVVGWSLQVLFTQPGHGLYSLDPQSRKQGAQVQLTVASQTARLLDRRGSTDNVVYMYHPIGCVLCTQATLEPSFCMLNMKQPQILCW